MEVGDLRLDGYIRVSRVGGREGEGYISPDVQRDAITSYASELGGSIIAWHDDQDYIGGNTERPGFQAMLDRLKDGNTDGIIVMSVDRFARSTADGSKIIREIVDRGQGQEARELLQRSLDDLDRHGLRNLLTGMIRHIFIRRAPRGSTPADRVLVVWSDDPERIDVPGPHRAGPFESIGW